MEKSKSPVNRCKCGGEAEVVKLYPHKRYDCFLRCKAYDIETRVYVSKQAAVKAWNKMTDR